MIHFWLHGNCNFRFSIVYRNWSTP